MSDIRHNEALNTLFVRLFRSLLQYAIECWPWTDGGQAAEQHAIEELAARQHEQASRIAELLDSRGFPVDYGNYPDWSELHYVSLDYLLGKLIADQTEIVADVKRLQRTVTGDAEASTLVAQVLVSEERQLSRLRELAAAREPAASLA